MRGCGAALQNSRTLLVEIKVVQLLRTNVAVSKEVKYTLPLWSSSSILGFYWREIKTYIHALTCTWLSVSALFIIVKNWKKPKRPSIGEQINRCGHIHTMEYQSAIKWGEVSVYTARINLNMVMLNEARPKNSTYHMIPLMQNSRKCKLISSDWGGRSVVTCEWGTEGGVTRRQHLVVTGVLTVDCSDGLVGAYTSKP